MMVKAMKPTHDIRQYLAIGIALSVSLCWSLSHAGTIREGHAVIGPPSFNTVTSSAFTATASAVRPVPFTLPAEQGLVLPTVPTVSKAISMGGTTVVPYIGAGFGGGYATELDRSIHTTQSASSGSFNAGQRNLFGQQLMPNEVQLGIRFPF